MRGANQIGAIAAGLVVVDIFVCLVMVLLALNDPTFTTANSASITLFSISVGCRILGLMYSIYQVCNNVNWFTILDACICIPLIVLKFTFSGKDALIYNFFILFRIGKVAIETRTYFFEQQQEIERKCQNEIRNSQLQVKILIQKLDATEKKVKVMLG
jgi:hypothetical protein